MDSTKPLGDFFPPLEECILSSQKSSREEEVNAVMRREARSLSLPFISPRASVAF